MLFGETKMEAVALARELVRMVPERLKEKGEDTRPPCSGGSRTEWSDALWDVLGELGTPLGYDAYDWLLDFVWWSKEPEHMALAVESELDPSEKAIEEDFEKLPSFKCPLKLLVFSGDADKTKAMAESYLQSFSQHVKDEKYLLVGFTATTPRAFVFRVPNDGPVQRVQFEEIQLQQGRAASGVAG
jgi:hypothetical protein